MITGPGLFCVAALIPNLVVANSKNDNSTLEWRFGITIPGTKWCGPGDRAEFNDDLGFHQAEDRCCRAHDLCDNIPIGAGKYGLINDDGLFPKKPCSCDAEFKSCLKGVRSFLANEIGAAYFLTQKRCYMEEHPIVSCTEREMKRKLFVTISRCVKYRVDPHRSKIYQWFDLSLYTSHRRLEIERY